VSDLTLADLCELVVDCKNRTPPAAAPGEAPAGFAIGTADIVDGRIRLEHARPVGEETLRRWNARAVPREGDLVLTREAPVGRVGRVEQGMHICLGQRTMLLRPHRERADSRFLHYLLRSPAIQGLLRAQASGSTVAHLRVGQVRELRIPPVPGLDEQRAIGATLGALDDKIAVNERIAATAMELGRARYLQVLAEADEQVRVGDVIELRYGKALPAARRIPGNVPVYGSGGIGGRHNEALVQGPGIVVGRKGTVGALHWSEADFFPIDTTFYVARRSEAVSLQYVYFALERLGLARMNSGSAVPGLNRERVHSLSLRIPPRAVMASFTALARSLFELRHVREEESRALAALRDALLPHLVSGRLRVKDAERLVADAT
jgi:type I restriction enzyme S subunit